MMLTGYYSKHFVAVLSRGKAVVVHVLLSVFFIIIIIKAAQSPHEASLNYNTCDNTL